MMRCMVCNQEAQVADVLPVCAKCIRSGTEEIESVIKQAHAFRYDIFKLPPKVPRESNGIKCNICANACQIPLNEYGYCGLQKNEKGHLEGKVSSTRALMHYYFDPHVTNCCGAYFCPAGTGSGFPQWAYKEGAERGYANLAVFFYGCGLDCLFCQNASHKQINQGKQVDLEQFLSVIADNQRISCVCYFGGSPEPQLPFTIKVMEHCKDQFNNRILRQCVEMNGHGSSSLMRKMGFLAEESGGIIKFDLKAYSEQLHRALCGVSNQTILKNFAMLADSLSFKNKYYPPLMATTLLVPYYVDEIEVAQIARFIRNLNPSIEYSLLIFHPDHLMRDLPATPLKQVQRCYDAAKRELGRPVHVGNLHLLAGKLRL